MKKIRTHKDAFKAFLMPDKYEETEGCVFCNANDHCDSCPVGFYCGGGNEINGVCWPRIKWSHQTEIVRYIIRNCKKWDLKNIERVARKKAIALGYEFEKRTPCT